MSNEPPFKRITLDIEEETFLTLKNAIAVKGMTGNAYGILDAFVMKLVKKVDEGEESWYVEKKSKE
jgi:hypothetical protein